MEYIVVFVFLYILYAAGNWLKNEALKGENMLGEVLDGMDEMGDGW